MRGSDSDAVRSRCSPRWPNPRTAHAAGVLGLMLTMGPALALAQAASATYQIPRQSIDGGAGRPTSALFTLETTIGQPDAGAAKTSASFSLRGGFQRVATAEAPPEVLFADGFEAR
jgi:hypothetical protein